MNTLLRTALAASLLSIPALAGAATVSEPASQPQSAMIVADASATHFTYTGGGSEAMPAFSYERGVPVISGAPLGQKNALGPDGSPWLVNQTGGGR
jgi:hypothetical protein